MRILGIDKKYRKIEDLDVADEISAVNEFNRQVFKMQCFPLYSILKAIGRTDIDYFSLDVEGAEYEILASAFKAKDFEFKVATIERTGIERVFNRTLTQLKYLLKRNGYQEKTSLQEDTLAVKKGFVRE